MVCCICSLLSECLSGFMVLLTVFSVTPWCDTCANSWIIECLLLSKDLLGRALPEIQAVKTARCAVF